MRPIGRIVFLAIVLVLAAAGARAQEPEATVEASKTVAAVTPPPETASEPAELMPNQAAAPEEGAVATAAGSLGGDASTAPSGGDPGPAPPKVDVEPLSSAGSPVVDTAANASPLDEENPERGERVSDWIFLGILALAAAVILARLARRREATLSIYGNRNDAALPARSAPPIVLRS